MLPCKECLTQAICKTKVDNNQLLTDTVKDLSDFCYLFEEYFPFFSGHDNDSVSYADNCGLTEEEWKKRSEEIWEYFRGRE